MLYDGPILLSATFLGETATYENRFINYTPKYEYKVVDRRA